MACLSCIQVERIVTAALNKLEGDLKGKYYPLGNMSEARSSWLAIYV